MSQENFWTEELLNEKLTTPSKRLLLDMRKISGDILVLGAGGKMGPSLCILAKKALDAIGSSQRVIAVSRFSDNRVVEQFTKYNIKMIKLDLLEEGALHMLPDAENLIFMAGKKFGTSDGEEYTWAMNTYLPGLVAHRFKESSIVVFSSGNIYPMMPIDGDGASEDTQPVPIGEYAMSCLGRERAFGYVSLKYGTKILMYRLNYAVDLRYGVLHDLAQRIIHGQPIGLESSAFNCIWQGDANEMAIRCLLLVDSPARALNVSGPEKIDVRYAAGKLGEYLGKTPTFEGDMADCVLLSDATKAISMFGQPNVSLDTLLMWQAEWILQGGRSLNKPTHSEERTGKF